MVKLKSTRLDFIKDSRSLSRHFCIKTSTLLILYVICNVVSGCGITKIFSKPEEKRDIDQEHTQIKEDDISSGYRVQIGIFNTVAEAEKLADSARSLTDYPVNIVFIAPFYRVHVGDFMRKSDAEECVEFFRQRGFPDSRYVYQRREYQ